MSRSIRKSLHDLQANTPVEAIREEKQTWLAKNFPSQTEDSTRISVSGLPIEPLYTPDTLAEFDYQRQLGFPGQPPFTRGVYGTMYQGRTWTVRQLAGF